MALVPDKNQRQSRFCIALFEPTKLILRLQKFGDYFLLEEWHIGILLLSALKIASRRFLLLHGTIPCLLSQKLRNAQTCCIGLPSLERINPRALAARSRLLLELNDMSLVAAVSLFARWHLDLSRPKAETVTA